MEKEQLKLLKDRSGGERIADTFTFLRINLAILLRTHVLLSLPVILLTAGVFLLLFPGDFSLMRTLDTGPFVDTTAERENRWQIFLEVMFMFSAFMPIGTNTLIVFDRFARNPERAVAFEDVWASFKRNFLKLYIAKVIMGVIIVVSGFLLFIPAIVFYTLFTCVEMLMLQHGFGIARAISRSSGIMSRSFWTPFGVNLGLFIIAGLGLLGINLMVPLLEWLASLVVSDVRSDSIWSTVGRGVAAFNAILSYLLYMLPAAGAGIQFFTLREEMARTDIMQRVREIGIQSSPANAQFTSDEQY